MKLKRVCTKKGSRQVRGTSVNIMSTPASSSPTLAVLGAATTLAATLLGGGGAVVPLELPVRVSQSGKNVYRELRRCAQIV